MWPWLEEGRGSTLAFPRWHHWLLATALIFAMSQVMPVVAGLL